MILLLPLLFGAIAAAPAAAVNHQATAIEASSASTDDLVLAEDGDARSVADHVHDSPPLMPEMALVATPPKWMSTWAMARTTAATRGLPCRPDEPPRRFA